MARAFPSEGEGDIIVLRADPYCDELYSGAYQQATIFIVGYDTEHETLFTRKQRSDALALARSKNLTFDGVVARACCHHVMVSLLGA